MGFVERAFTPPGTGGREAAEQIAAANAQQLALAQAQPAPVPPTMPKGPEAPPVFQPGQAPGEKQRARVSATTMLGAAATGGQTAKKSVLGG